MNELTFTPTYEVIYKDYDLDKESITIILVNIGNDFDVIKIRVSKDVSNVVEYGSQYTIDTRIKRIWYTLWLSKKEEYKVLGNVDKKGQVLITTGSLSKKGLEDFQNGWNGIKKWKRLE